MPHSSDQLSNELLKYLKANLLIQLNLGDEKKPEHILFDAGFTIAEVANLLRKKYKTVQKTLERSGRKG